MKPGRGRGAFEGGAGAPAYGRLTIALHWVTVGLVVALAACGLAMTRLDLRLDRTFALYQIHKSLGLCVLAVTLLRLWLRLRGPAPPAPTGSTPAAWAAARLGHAGLLAALLGAALSGWLMVSASPLGLPTEWFGLVRIPHLPGFAELSSERRGDLEAVWRGVHKGAVALLAVLIGGHSAMALWHARAGHHVLERIGFRRRSSG